MYRIMGEIAGPVRHALMSAPDSFMAGRVDAHCDLALLRRALKSAGFPFVEDRGQVYVIRADGEENLFNAIDVQQDADALYCALRMSCSQLLWYRRLVVPSGQRGEVFRSDAAAWRRAVVNLAAALPPAIVQHGAPHV